MFAVLLILAAVGIFLWQFHVRVPMDATIKGIIYVIVIGAVLIWLLRIAGVWHGPAIRF